MRCTVHIRKSFDYGGTHFVLRLFPSYCSEGGRKAETFTSEGTLARRLIEMGLPEVYAGRGLANLRVGGDASWTNVEIAEEIFESFGRIECRMPISA
jgi:hypothetical protein